MSFSKTNEIFIQVWRADVNRDCDRLEVAVPVTRNVHDDYATITSDLCGIAYMPTKNSWSTTPSWTEGPRTFQIEVKPTGGYGSVKIGDLQADLKAIAKIMKRYEAQIVRPKTFGEQVALLAHAAKLPVKLIRPETNFGLKHMGDQTYIFKCDANGLASLRETLDGAIARQVAQRRVEIGIDPKPEATVETEGEAVPS